MESFVITWRELLVGVVLVLAVYIAEILLLTRSSANRGVRLWRKGAMAHAEAQEMEEIKIELACLREQVMAVQEDVNGMKSTQASTPSSTPYSQAINLAQQGLDASQVAASCGISRGEAELIVALYRTNIA